MNIFPNIKRITICIIINLLGLYTIIAQEINLVDNKGTIKTVNNNNVTTAAIAPTSPVENDIWFDTSTTPNSIKIWDGTVWLNLEHTGTTGSIFFAGSTGTPIENNTQLRWDNTLNRLSIGTPLAGTNKVTVQGAIRATAFNNADGTFGTPSYRFSNDSDTGMYRIGTNQLGFTTGGTSALKIDGSQNVGVGDFSSGTIDAKLHVKSNDVPFKIEPSTTTPTGTSGGQMHVDSTNGILYIYDGTRAKWLSVDRTMVGWGRNSANTTNEYLRQFNGAQSNNNGWRMIRDGTITAITAQTNINQTWTLEIRKNDATAVITSLTITAAQGGHINTLNVDINEGDFIQAFCNGTTIDFPEALIEIAWRK